jgi:hypothetical protein
MIISLNFIIKDFKNDNLINIVKKSNEYMFNCSCGVNYCHHLDYIIHKISADTNNKICYDDHFKIIGFDCIEYLQISIQENDKFIHNVLIQFLNNHFEITCSCKNSECYYCKYAVIELISDYLKKKDLVNTINNDILLLQEIENDLDKLQI